MLSTANDNISVKNICFSKPLPNTVYDIVKSIRLFMPTGDIQRIYSVVLCNQRYLKSLWITQVWKNNCKETGLPVTRNTLNTLSLGRL